MTIKDNILVYAAHRQSFTKEELWSWLKDQMSVSWNSVACVLSKMLKNDDLQHVGKGTYAKAQEKGVFKMQPEESEKHLFALLKKRLPFTAFCVYNGTALAPLQHHLSNNTMTYVETDRAALDSVFNILKENGMQVWLSPDEDMVYHYIDLCKGGVIVKPLVTEAPLKVVDGVPQPTLEKLLVDINKDADFAYLQGAESERIWEMARSLHVINETRLKRYAKRRGMTLNDFGR